MDEFAKTSECTALMAQPHLSRRAFFSLTAVAGALTFLGEAVTPWGRVLAYADEDHSTHFVVYILNAEEVPVLALDVSDKNNSKPVENAVITISNDKGSLTLKKTDKTGFTVANIKSIAEEQDPEDAESYIAYAEVTASCAGYRSFEERTQLVSGIHANAQGEMPNVLRVPTVPLKEDSPYLSRMSFDGLDMQYTDHDAFILKSNNYKNQIDLTLRNAGNKTWDFSLLSGTTVLETTQARASGGTAQARFSGAYLSGKAGFNPESTLAIRYSEHGSSKGADVVSKLSFAEGVMPLDDGNTSELMLSPGRPLTPARDESSEKAMTKLPKWMAIDGLSVTCGFPLLPVQIICDPNGFIAVTATTGCWIAKYRGSENKILKKGDRWKPLKPTSCYKAFASGVENELKKSQALRNQLRDSGKSFGHAKLLHDLDVAIDMELKGIGGTKKVVEGGEIIKKGEMTLSLGSRFVVFWQMSMPFQAGPIPLFWSFDLNFTFMYRLAGYLTFKNAFQDIRWKVAPNGKSGATNQVIDANLEVGLSVHLGIRNVASVGIRGYGFIKNTAIIPFTDDVEGSLVGKIGCGVQLIVQALFLKITPIAAHTKDHEIYHSTRGGKSNLSYTEAVGELEETGRDAFLALWQGVQNEAEAEALDWSAFEPYTLEELAEAVEYHILINGLDGNEGHYDDDEAWSAGFMLPVNATNGFPVAGSGDEITGGIEDPYDTSSDAGIYNPIRGIKPSKQDLVKTTVYSDPRATLVDCVGPSGQCHYFFRIGLVLAFANDRANDAPRVVVDSKGHLFFAPTSAENDANNDMPDYASLPDANAEDLGITRSRLMYSAALESSWYYENEVSFSAPDRANSWDTDFSVYSHYSHNLILLCSTTKPFETQDTFQEVFKTQYLTLVDWDLKGGRKGYVLPGKSDVARWNPRLHAARAEISEKGKHDFDVACYFYEIEKDAVSESGMGATRIGKASATFASDALVGDITMSTVEVPNCISSILADGTLEVAGLQTDDKADVVRPVPSVDQGKQRVLAWSCPARNNHEAMAVIWAEGNPGGAKVIKNVSSFTCLPSTGKTISFVMARDAVQAERKQILKVDYDPSTEAFTITSPMGPTTITTFTSARGDFASKNSLIAARIMEGELPPVNESAKKAISEGASVCGATYGSYSSPVGTWEDADEYGGGIVQQYQLLRADYIEDAGMYSDFYPYAQLTNRPDSVIEIFHPDASTTLRAGRYQTVTINDDLPGTADIYQIEIPNVLGLQLESVEPATRFCMDGDPCKLTVTVTNTGNTPIQGFTVNIQTVQGGKKTSKVLTELEKAVTKSLDNYIQELDEEGNPTGNRIMRDVSAMEYCLYPGQTRGYTVVVDMPKGLHGDVEFAATVSDPVPWVYRPTTSEDAASTSSATDSFAASEPYELCVDPRAFNFTVSPEENETTYCETDLSGPEETIWGKGNGKHDPTPDPKPKPDPNTNPDPDPGSTNGGRALPTTGDASGGLSLGGLAVGALAAGVLAYEKRRAENEGQS